MDEMGLDRRMFTRPRFRGKGWGERRARPVLLITGLDEEADVLIDILLKAGFAWTPSEPLANINCEHFTYMGGERTNCVVVSSRGMGRLEAAVAASMACIRLDPSFVFLVGIAGGFRYTPSDRKLKLGDVIVASEIADVDMRRIYAPKEMKVRLRRYKASEELLAAARAVETMRWYAHIAPRIRKPIPEVHYGIVVSSESVMGDAEHFLSRISRAEFFDSNSDWPHGLAEIPIGIEMEGGGVALAVDRCTQGIGFLMVRGVSDFADSEKNNDEQTGRCLAKRAACSFVVSMLRSERFVAILKNSARAR